MTDLIQLPRCTAHPNALELPDDLTVTEWAHVGRILRDAGESLWWFIGDWRNFADSKLMAEHSAAVRTFIEEELKFSAESVRKAAYVANKILPGKRFPNLSFSHHLCVAPMKPAEHKKWLSLAEENQWTIKELIKAMRDDGQDSRTVQTNAESRFSIETWITEGQRNISQMMSEHPFVEWSDDLIIDRIRLIDDVRTPFVAEARRRQLQVA